MKKHFLLLASLFSLSLSNYADISYKDAYWVIKDGKFTGNATYMPYEDLGTDVANEMEETTIDGENVVIYKQLSENYLDARFSLSTPLDLNKNYILFLEYKIPASHTGLQLIEGNKPLFMFGLNQTAESQESVNAPHSDATICIDAKWGVAEEWVTTTQYIYINPSITSISGLIFSYAREYLYADMDEFPSIRNFGFLATEDGIKPFYAENFDGFGLGEFYNEKNDISSSSKVFNGGVNPIVTPNDVSNFDDEGMPALTAFRDFRADSEKGQDGSGYLDDEILHALQVETNRDSIVFPGIQIPAGCSKIYSQLLLKKHKNEKNLWRDADYETVADMDVNIKLKFNTGQMVDLSDDRIPLIWTKYAGEIDVPEGATAADLIFYSMPVGYLADEILLSASAFNNVEDFMSDNNGFEVQAYVAENGDIVVLNGELQAVYNLKGVRASEKDTVIVILAKNSEGKTGTKLMLRK